MAQQWIDIFDAMVGLNKSREWDIGLKKMSFYKRFLQKYLRK